MKSAATEAMRREVAAKAKLVSILERLPDDETRARVLIATAVILRCEQAVGIPLELAWGIAAHEAKK